MTSVSTQKNDFTIRSNSSQKFTALNIFGVKLPSIGVIFSRGFGKADNSNFSPSDEPPVGKFSGYSVNNHIHPELELTIVDVGDTVDRMARLEARERMAELLAQKRGGLKGLLSQAYLRASEEYHKQKLFVEAREKQLGSIGSDGAAVLSSSEMSALFEQTSFALENRHNASLGLQVRVVDKSTEAMRYFSDAFRDLMRKTASAALDTGAYDAESFEVARDKIISQLTATSEWREMATGSESLGVASCKGWSELMAKLTRKEVGRNEAFEIIEKAKIAFSRPKFLNASSHLSSADRLIQRLESIPGLNIASTSLGVGLLASVGSFLATRAWSGVARVFGTIGGGAVAAGGIAALKAHKKVNEDYQAILESHTLKRTTSIKTQALVNIATEINSSIPRASSLINELEGWRTTMLDNASPFFQNGRLRTTVHKTIKSCQEIRTRLELGMSHKADFVLWDSPESIESGRLALLRAVALAERSIFEEIEKLPAAERDSCRALCEKERQTVADNTEKYLIGKLCENQQALRAERLKACRKAFLAGATLGASIASVTTLIGEVLHREGTPDLKSSGKSPGAPTTENPTSSHTSPTEGGGRIDTHSTPPRSSSVEGAPHRKSVSTKEYLEYLRSKGAHVEKIARTGFYDNGTHRPDGNELRLKLGGINRSGLTASGDFELDISSMTPKGSHSGALHPNIHDLRAHGHLKALVTLDSATQKTVISFDIDPHTGKVIIPHDHPAAREIFDLPRSKGGNIQLKARFIEIAEKVYDKQGHPAMTSDGRQAYRILATDVGSGHSKFEIPATIPQNIHGTNTQSRFAPILMEPKSRKVEQHLISQLVELPVRRRRVPFPLMNDDSFPLNPWSQF